MSQARIKVNQQAKERIRILAAPTDATQTEIVDREVREYAARPANEVAAGMERARAALASGDAVIAAYLLDEPVEAIEQPSPELWVHIVTASVANQDGFTVISRRSDESQVPAR